MDNFKNLTIEELLKKNGLKIKAVSTLLIKK
jgi:hypothetical protein